MSVYVFVFDLYDSSQRPRPRKATTDLKSKPSASHSAQDVAAVLHIVKWYMQALSPFYTYI